MRMIPMTMIASMSMRFYTNSDDSCLLIIPIQPPLTSVALWYIPISVSSAVSPLCTTKSTNDLDDRLIGSVERPTLNLVHIPTVRPARISCWARPKLSRGPSIHNHPNKGKDLVG